MADETRRLLKVFGVAVTDFEAEAEKLEAAAAQLSAASGKDQIGKLMKDVTELCRELNTRWPMRPRGYMSSIPRRSNRPGWKPMNEDRKQGRLSDRIPDNKEDLSCRRQ